MKTQNINKDIITQAIDKIDSLIGFGEVEASDLHHHCFNEDYFIIGTYQAKQWLESYGTFDAIEKVQSYEQDNFGEVTTDLGDAEKVANMVAYIEGEELLNGCEILQDKWNEKLDDKDLHEIKEWLEGLI